MLKVGRCNKKKVEIYQNIRFYAKKKFAPPEGIILNDGKTTFGNLKDEDRIYQNLYGRHDWRLDGACRRGDWYRTKDLICQGSDWIMDQVVKAGLRGRGGAGFYAGIKWEFLKKNSGEDKILCVNCAEGEPGTCKDREIIRHEPHKILEGALLGAVAMGANRAFIYVRARFYNEACNIQLALAEAYSRGFIGKNACGSGYDFDINIQRGGRYICGEETALVKCLMGAQGRPTRKPPFLSEKGYFGKPTIVVNAETISVLPTLLRRGPKWFTSLGRSYNSGTKLFTISGNVNDPCTVEEEMSTPLKEIIEKHAGGVTGGWENLRVIFPGGSSTPLIDADTAESVLADFDCMKSVGSSLGSGAIIVVSKSVDLVKLLYSTIKFYKHETCKQCTQCREGSIWLTEMFSRFVEGNAQPEEIDWVTNISKYMHGQTICALASGQAFVGDGLVKFCKDEILDRIKKYSKC